VDALHRSTSQRRVLGVLAGLVVASGLVAAHVATASRGDEYTGVLLLFDHLFTVALVLGLFAIAAGLGGRLLKAGGIKTDGPLESLLFWTPVGLGTLASAIVLVGLFFSVRPVVLLALLAGAAFLGRDELRQLPSLVGDALAWVRTRADRLSLSVFLLMAALLPVRALAPPTDWDALMYHLRAPQQFLERGFIHLPDDNTHVALVGLPHMVYLPLLALGSEAGPALVSALCTLGLALAGFAFAARFLDDRTAASSLAVLWGSTVLLLVAWSPRTDTILAFYLFLAHYAVIRAATSGEPRHLYLAAALGGMALGVKYNALPYLLTLTPLGLWTLWARIPKRTVVLVLVLGVGVGTGFPWLLKNALLFEDPLYPFLSGRRLDAWLAPMYGGAAFPPQFDPDVAWGAQVPFNLIDFFAAPQRITVEAEGGQYHANVLLLFLPLWFWHLKNAVLTWLVAPALAYVGLVLMLQPTTSLRYLIPALLPLTLVALYSYASTWAKRISPPRMRRVLAVTTLVVLAGTASVLYHELVQGRALAHALGLTSRQAFLEMGTAGYANAVSFVNERLPRDSRVLMLFEARGYFVRVPVLQDNLIMNWPLLAERATPDCLRSAGITHVLINRGAVD
jgi:hypothetical protein